MLCVMTRCRVDLHPFIRGNPRVTCEITRMTADLSTRVLILKVNFLNYQHSSQGTIIDMTAHIIMYQYLNNYYKRKCSWCGHLQQWEVYFQRKCDYWDKYVWCHYNRGIMWLVIHSKLTYSISLAVCHLLVHVQCACNSTNFEPITS